ncbi:MAG: hypothetical protein ACO1OY_02965 [Ramlibacter sp.]|jgi:hypothetical protein
MVEHVWGPINGFWLAAYAAPLGDGGRFCSYAKVCWQRPTDYWTADCAFKVFGGEHHASLDGALTAVADVAQDEIDCLPRHARSIAAQHWRDRLPVPRLFVTSFFRQRAAA